VKKQFVVIDKVIVNAEVFTTPFHCDLKQCNGACCTLESEFGAPLSDEEIVKIETILTEALEYLPELNRSVIRSNGFYQRKHGQLLTRSIGNKDCVFVYYSDGVALCAIEKAYFDGRINFRKPLSCHLFPIRVSQFAGDVLRYERFEHCDPALELGKAMNITISQFCKESLERAYGPGWYEQLEKTAKEIGG
jgi:Fe-S-cluster containining protein